MNRKLYLFFIMLTGIIGVYLYRLPMGMQQRDKVSSTSLIQKTHRDHSQVSVAKFDYQVKKNQESINQRKVTPKQELTRYQQDMMDEKALMQLEQLRNIPGARELLDEISTELERDPDLISYDHISSGKAVVLDDNFYKKMIPNPGFRKKWLQLMDLIASSYNH